MNNILAAKTINAALLVGTLDILAASGQFYLKTGMGPAPIFKFIASGVFGKEAFAGGNLMIFYGFLFHYFIAFVFTIFFFWICRKWPSVLKPGLLTGVLYGALIWIVMNLVVLPISSVRTGPFDLAGALTGMSILIVCVGVPLSLIAANGSKGLRMSWRVKSGMN